MVTPFFFIIIKSKHSARSPFPFVQRKKTISWLVVVVVGNKNSKLSIVCDSMFSPIIFLDRSQDLASLSSDFPSFVSVTGTIKQSNNPDQSIAVNLVSPSRPSVRPSFPPPFVILGKNTSVWWPVIFF